MALLELLAAQGFVVLDGGFATELEAKGANLNDPLWSGKLLLDAPHLLEQVNYDYLCAGSDISITASYQATIPGLLSRGLTGPQAEAVIRHSVELARHARDRFWSDPRMRNGRFKPLVVASVGPYGAYLHDGSEYRGHYGLSRDELKDFHRDRLAILADSNPDLIAFESLPSQLEAEAITDLLLKFPNARCWISFTCRDGESISEGTALGEAVKAVAGTQQVLAVGVNCVAPSYVLPLIRAAKNETDKPLVAYPNSGACYDASSGAWGRSGDPTVIQNAAVEWYKAGARLIGGCCLTTPETIRSIRAALTELHLPV